MTIFSKSSRSLGSLLARSQLTDRLWTINLRKHMATSEDLCLSTFLRLCSRAIQIFTITAGDDDASLSQTTQARILLKTSHVGSRLKAYLQSPSQSEEPSQTSDHSGTFDHMIRYGTDPPLAQALVAPNLPRAKKRVPRAKFSGRMHRE